MARFDLHRLDGTLVVDLQHELLDHLPTRVVAPLLPPDRAGRPVRDLNPVMTLEGAPHILAVHLLAAVPRRELGPPVGTLEGDYDSILRAVDMLLLTGL
ncbi:CcdB family protein [Belnapia sp. T6]|uniref:Toxin CcdB n=1 Tax=Belnapia mucosa TaxID=2804532 RepID=A0ABS1V6M4_9PROT|nr:CcdB family protein [Belnapia mucosa]MBL6457323.1 CcdB family protein [Belnapia mucosa]